MGIAWVNRGRLLHRRRRKNKGKTERPKESDQNNWVVRGLRGKEACCWYLSFWIRRQKPPLTKDKLDPEWENNFKGEKRRGYQLIKYYSSLTTILHFSYCERTKKIDWIWDIEQSIVHVRMPFDVTHILNIYFHSKRLMNNLISKSLTAVWDLWAQIRDFITANNMKISLNVSYPKILAYCEIDIIGQCCYKNCLISICIIKQSLIIILPSPKFLSLNV